jgi:hypothetical protein
VITRPQRRINLSLRSLVAQAPSLDLSGIKQDRKVVLDETDEGSMFGVLNNLFNGISLSNNQFCGSSAAAPAIAGAAALLESAGFDRAHVLKALRSTAVPLGAAAWDSAYGFGLADVAAAWKSGGF